MLKSNELFIATTDTIVGIGAPISESNKQSIYAIKKRPTNKQLIIMVGSIAQASKLSGWNQKVEKFAKLYWPGAVTLVVSKTLAIRMPNCQKLCDFILEIGPIYMTSANISGKKSLSFEEAKKEFKTITKHLNFCSGSNKPSTIIDINTKEILR